MPPRQDWDAHTPSRAPLAWGYICLAAMPPCLSAAVCLRAALRLQRYGYFGNYADVVAVNVGITDFIFMLVLWMLTA